MRELLISFLILMGLSGCGYSAKSVITVHGDAQQLQVELDEYVKYLRRHRDGCFSERITPMLVSGPPQQQSYQISAEGSALDLSLSLNKAGNAIQIELNEWAEERFTPHAAQCYQQLIKGLVARYGSHKIEVLEICKAARCR